MSTEIFMRFIGFLIVSFVLVMGLKRLVKRYPVLKMSPSGMYPPKEIFTFLVKDKAALKKLLFTIGMLVIFKTSCLIPLPGLNIDALRSFFGQASRSVSGTVSMLLPGAWSRVSIFALGLMPYLSACLLMQIISALIPKLRHLLFSGEQGRIKVKKYSCILAICLGITQAYFLSQWLQTLHTPQGLNIVTMEGWIFNLLTIITLTGAVALLIFISELINKHGLGNGIAMIVLSGILMRIIAAPQHLFKLYADRQLSFIAAIFIVAVLIAFIYVIFYVTTRVKKIEIKSLDQKEKISLPLRLSWVGKVPLAMAQSICLFPATLAMFFSGVALGRLAHFLSANIWMRIIFTSILIFILTYFYAAIVFRPRYIHKLLNKYKFTSDIPEGKDIERYLNDTMSKLLIITAVFLIFTSTIFTLISQVLAIPYMVLSLFGGAIGLVLIVGIFFDLVKQIEFLMKKAKYNIKDWSITYIAFDEIEAEIKKGYLRSRGIIAEVEPLRFTWGMPIRTAVDQYRIYTPTDTREESRKLLTEE